MIRYRRAQEKGLTLLELLIGMTIISILAMVSLPMYSEYQTRTKIVEDFKLIGQVKGHVAEYYTTNGEMPTKNEHLGLGKDKTITGVRLEKLKVDKNPEPGTIKVHWDRKNALPQLGKDNDIEFVPTVVNGIVTWDCRSGDMADKYRPPNCRGDGPYDKKKKK